MRGHVKIEYEKLKIHYRQFYWMSENKKIKLKINYLFRINL